MGLGWVLAAGQIVGSLCTSIMIYIYILILILFLLYLDPRLTHHNSYKCQTSLGKLLPYFEWSSPWHTILTWFLTYHLDVFIAYIYILTFFPGYAPTFYLTIVLAFYLTYVLTFYLAIFLSFDLTYILTFCLAFCLAFYLTFYLTCVRAP